MVGSWGWVLGTYLVGSIPTGTLVSIGRYQKDVRKHGSGNPGATNMVRVFGWKAGIAVFVVDFLKGYVPVALAVSTGNSGLILLVASAAVVGHCWSVFLKFHGGKGVATSVGCLFATAPIAGLWMAGVYLASLLAFRVSAVGSLLGIAAAAVWMFAIDRSNLRWMVLSLALIVYLRHGSNIRRLIALYCGRRRRNVSNDTENFAQ